MKRCGAGLALLVLGLLAPGCKQGGQAAEREAAERENTCSEDELHRRGTCTRKALVLPEGVLRDRVDAAFIGQAESVRLEATATVQRGAVRVWFEARGGALQEVVVRPGAPARLAGRPRTERGPGVPGFVLYYQPLEGTPPRAEGLAVELRYDLEEG